MPLGGSLRRSGGEIADGRQFDGRQGLQTGEMLPGNLSGSDKRRLHEVLSKMLR